MDDELYWVANALKSGSITKTRDGGFYVTVHNYGGINIPDNKGAFALGEGNTVNQQNNNEALQDLTSQLLSAITQEQFSEEKKAELKQVIESTEQLANAEKPDKVIVDTMIGRASTLIDTVAKTPGLITAFGAWKQLILTHTGLA
ncbi:hypothetical protein [Domibacillus iocasae]|uniref:Uncharacterized protein n=1 Tax=Domibacillus iocasae TaxID=1714016 RepID=A0A1E7DQ51_9BACI|nr:hypothetical protein [Domibacillus iocasae]OES45212.1 hypothetical protein BA724_04180 [Domibacillus iocasae]